MENHCHDEDFGTTVSLGTDILQKSFFLVAKNRPPPLSSSFPSQFS